MEFEYMKRRKGTDKQKEKRDKYGDFSQKHIRLLQASVPCKCNDYKCIEHVKSMLRAC